MRPFCTDADRLSETCKRRTPFLASTPSNRDSPKTFYRFSTIRETGATTLNCPLNGGRTARGGLRHVDGDETAQASDRGLLGV